MSIYANKPHTNITHPGTVHVQMQAQVVGSTRLGRSIPSCKVSAREAKRIRACRPVALQICKTRPRPYTIIRTRTARKPLVTFLPLDHTGSAQPDGTDTCMFRSINPCYGIHTSDQKISMNNVQRVLNGWDARSISECIVLPLSLYQSRFDF